jgi:hypothetical protein
MGGFALKVDNGATKFIEPENGMTRIPLTAKGVLLLAQCGYIPDISRGEIKDKSKADLFANTLVCLQAGWCVLQYIGRLAAGLPVSLLEINTLGHALCALAIYISWWRKPLDIEEPHILSGDSYRPLFAASWMGSSTSRSVLKDDRDLRCEMQDLSWDAAVEGREGEIAMDELGDAPTMTLSSDDYLFGHRLDPDGRAFQDQVFRTGIWRWQFLTRIWGWLWRNRPLRQLFPPSIGVRIEPAIQTVELSAVDIRRWRLASDALRKHPELDFGKW